MRHVVLLAALLLSMADTSIAGGPSIAGEPARTAPSSAAESMFRDPGYAPAGVVQQALPPIAADRVEALRKHNAESGLKMLKIGIERGAAELSAANEPLKLHWQPAPGGGSTARFAIASPGATALRLGLGISGLPDGAELRFAGPGDAGSVVPAISAEQVRRQRAIDPVLWTPVTDGDTQLVEIWLPHGANADWLRVTTQAVSHLVVSPTGALDAAKIGESQACELDAKCVDSPSQAYVNAKNAVARMVFQNGGSFLCTGTLLNDNDSSSQIPYFFSAAHCFTSQTVANSLTTFWFDEATACGSGVLDSSSVQLTGGAELLYADEPSDVLFVRLNGSPPAGAYFLGWDASDIAADTSILVLHHPAGDVKKVSLGRTTGTGGSSLASGSFIQAGYTAGTTEGGSSGCGLLTLSGGEYRLRGGLLGGSASCSNSGDLNTAGNSDDYSRFDLAFTHLSQYLQSTTTTPPPPSSTDFSGTWFNPEQNGWGLNVIRGSTGTYAMFIYHYDDDSTPAWYLSTGTLSNSQYSSTLLAFNGPWFGGTFTPSTVSSRTAGTLAVSFSSATAATISFTLDGRTVTTTLQKLDF